MTNTVRTALFLATIGMVCGCVQADEDEHMSWEARLCEPVLCPTDLNFATGSGFPTGFTNAPLVIDLPFELQDNPSLIDMNGDGYLDIMAPRGTNVIMLALGDGKSFATPEPWQVPEYPATFRDVDGDKKPEIIVYDVGSEIGYFPNLGNRFGGFISVPTNRPDAFVHNEFDLNGDGFDDLITGFSSSGYPYNTIGDQIVWGVHFGLGASYGSQTNWPIPLELREQFWSQDWRVEDIDGDGLADLLNQDNETNTLRVWRNVLNGFEKDYRTFALPDAYVPDRNNWAFDNEVVDWTVAFTALDASGRAGFVTTGLNSMTLDTPVLGEFWAIQRYTDDAILEKRVWKLPTQLPTAFVGKIQALSGRTSDRPDASTWQTIDFNADGHKDLVLYDLPSQRILVYPATTER